MVTDERLLEPKGGTDAEDTGRPVAIDIIELVHWSMGREHFSILARREDKVLARCRLRFGSWTCTYNRP